MDRHPVDPELLPSNLLQPPPHINAMPSSGEYTTAMIHLFRAEVMRSNVWRQRLDATTNWAVVTTAASLSFAFGDPSTHHSVIVLTMLLVTLFLYMEARRYRYYELWSTRVRLLETGFLAPMLVPPPAAGQPSSDWAVQLAASLHHPEFSISIWEALGRRLRRNYLWLYLLLTLVWVLKVWLFPGGVTTLAGFMERAAVGAIPGELVILVTGLINGVMLLTGMLTLRLNQAKGEVL